MLLTLLSASLTLAGDFREAYRPTTAQVAASYRTADTIGSVWASQTSMLRLQPHWLDGGKAFWYRRDLDSGRSEYVRVSSVTGEKTPLFDAKQLAAALERPTGRKIAPDRLPIQNLSVDSGKATFNVDRQGYRLDLGTYALEKANVEPASTRTEPPWVQDTWPADRNPSKSPDGAWTARIVGTNVVVRGKEGKETSLTSDGSDSGYYARLTWLPSSRRLVAVKVHPGNRKKVYLIQNSPKEWGPAKLLERVYDRPGDRVDTFDVVVLDPTLASPAVNAPAIDYGELPGFRPTKSGGLTYEKMDRGYGRWRIIELDSQTGASSTVFDDHPKTFVDSTALVNRPLEGSDEVIVSSERDGWHHLYLADGKGGVQQITHGEWVVRGVESVDEKARQIVFTASGMNAGEDPYFVHYYRIKFDGSGLVSLTPAKGTHSAKLSPDGKVLVDTYSTVQDSPVHELRRADTGALVATVDRADVTRLLKGDWRAPQPFVAKGRDAKTDIYGVVFRPTHFVPKASYPVVEDIYAGPQDSFVPKEFSPNYYDQRIAELGFVVVKIDGMGTRNRSKAFHDVCYKNLADAGFPDRILWMKALAQSDAAVDIRRVGVFGTSAGGQNAGGAVLFHPEFYKVAVASCGCHDNRLDKIWWNEQWMGNMGPHYAASSNIENAYRLKGNLLLMVGELDTNVPPESTYRFASALQTAGKEFELVVIPNSDHTAGGPYGERKRRDFLVRHLLGVDPPNPNTGE